ncbi:hypothetical protein PINS_up003335 [Pythium insidiosum]|nr:hypothetical protein PINS_up003335 [Pythium insidiosum]
MPRGSISSVVAPQPTLPSSRRVLRQGTADISSSSGSWRAGIYTLRPSRDLPVIEATSTLRTALFPASTAAALGLFTTRHDLALTLASVVGGGLGMATPFLPAALGRVLAPIATALTLPPLCLAFLPLRVGMVAMVTRTFEFWYHTITNVVVGVLGALYTHDHRALMAVSMVPWFLLGVLRDAHVRAQRHDSLLAALMALLAFGNAFYIGAGALDDHRSYILLRYHGRSITIEALLAHGLLMLGILEAHLAYARRPQRVVRPDGAVQTSIACTFLQTPLQWHVASRSSRQPAFTRSARSEFSPTRIRLRCTSFRHIIDSDNVLCRRASAWLLPLPSVPASASVASTTSMTSATRKTSAESAVSSRVARRLSGGGSNANEPPSSNNVLVASRSGGRVVIRVASAPRRTSRSSAQRASTVLPTAAPAVDAEPKTEPTHQRPLYVWMLRAWLQVLGVAGLVTTVAPFVLFARRPPSSSSETSWLLLWRVALTSAACTTAFHAFFWLLVYQLDVLVHLYSTFSFLFIVVQLVLAHVALADLCRWDARALALLSSAQWTLWALSIDAIPPVRATQLGLRPKRWSRAILVSAIAAIVVLTWDALRVDSQRLQDRELVAFHVRGQRVSWFVFTFLMNRCFSLFTWLLRVLWRLGLVRDSDDLILIRGTVVYEDYLQLLSRRPREDGERVGERVGEVVAALMQQSGASGGREDRRLWRSSTAPERDPSLRTQRQRPRLWSLVNVVRGSQQLRRGGRSPGGSAGVPRDSESSTVTQHERSFHK